jgi:hypothetical protein
MHRLQRLAGRSPGRSSTAAALLTALGVLAAAGLASSAGASVAPPSRQILDRVPVELAPAPAAQAMRRAAAVGLALGLRGQPIDIEEVRDGMIGRTVDEVTLGEPGRHTGLVVHDASSGHPVAVTNLVWTPADDLARMGANAVPAAAARLARSAGLAVQGNKPDVRWDDAADAWEVSWIREVDGIRAPTNGLTIRLRRSGSLASLSAPKSALAPAPAHPIPAGRAVAVGRAFARGHGLDAFPGFTVESLGLAWSEANGFTDGEAAIDPTLHLCQVVRIAFTPEGSEPRLIELHVDAGSGAIIGGDQTS